MATILPLTRSAEATARHHASRGNLPRAYRIIRQLLKRPEATGLTASRWHGLAATFCLPLSRYDRALQHLRLAYKHDRTNRTLALRIAKWYEAEGDDERASKWRTRAGVRPQTKPVSFLRIVRADEPAILKLRTR